MQQLIRRYAGVISTRIGYTTDAQKRVAEDTIAECSGGAMSAH